MGCSRLLTAISKLLDKSTAQTICTSDNVGSANTYSLYPFFPSHVASRKLQSTSPFRLRQVGQWLSKNPMFTLDQVEDKRSLLSEK